MSLLAGFRQAERRSDNRERRKAVVALQYRRSSLVPGEDSVRSSNEISISVKLDRLKSHHSAMQVTDRRPF